VTGPTRLANRGGGKPEIVRALTDALEWLSRHQTGGGCWGVVSNRDDCSAISVESVDEWLALTGLSLLAFVRSGHHHAFGPHAATVRSGIGYLMARQEPSGQVGASPSTHGLAMLVLCEAYRRTGAQILRGAAQRAIDHALAARIDSPWMGPALEAARAGGLNVPRGLTIPLERPDELYPLLLTSFRSGGLAWRDDRAWIEELTVELQDRGAGCARGSWRPAFAPQGGRVAATAIGALLLALYFNAHP